MYLVTKKLSVPVGHRLSKHSGKCQYIHGHNLNIEVTLASNDLNENDMVIDFSDLKRIVKKHLDKFDHALLVNKNDANLDSMICNTITFPYDPTAERLAKYLYDKICNELGYSHSHHIIVWSVAIWENENSKAEFTKLKVTGI